MSQPRQHSSDKDLARNYQLPTGIFNLDLYQPMEEGSDRFIKGLLEDLWHVKSTRISLPDSRYYASDTSIFFVETPDGTNYEYTYPAGHDLSPGLHLLRRVFDDRSRGPWKEPEFWEEAVEKNRRENRAAGWGRPRGPLTEEKRAAASGLKELQWMQLGGKDNRHAAAFWLSLKKPPFGTREEKSFFAGRFKEHAKK